MPPPPAPAQPRPGRARYRAPMRRVPAAVLACLGLALLVVALAGCGKDTAKSNAYVDEVNRAQNQFATTSDRLANQITATSTTVQDRKVLAGFGTAVESVVRRLRGVDPPEGVDRLHGQLIAAIDGYGDEIEKARVALRSNNAQRIIAAQTELVSAITAVSARINRTIDQINRELQA
jgi:hypothetical protein